MEYWKRVVNSATTSIWFWKFIGTFFEVVQIVRFFFTRKITFLLFKMSPCCYFTPFHTSKRISIAISKLQVEFLQIWSRRHKKTAAATFDLSPPKPVVRSKWCSVKNSKQFQREGAARSLRLSERKMMPEGSGSAGTLEAPPTCRLRLTVFKRVSGHSSLTRLLIEFVSMCGDGRWPGKDTTLECWRRLETCGSDWTHKVSRSIGNVVWNCSFDKFTTSPGEKVVTYFCSHCWFGPDRKISWVDSFAWRLFVCPWLDVSVVASCTFPVLKWNIYCSVILYFFPPCSSESLIVAALTHQSALATSLQEKETCCKIHSFLPENKRSHGAVILIDQLNRSHKHERFVPLVAAKLRAWFHWLGSPRRGSCAFPLAR